MLYLHYEDIPGIPNAANPKLRQGIARFVFSGTQLFSVGTYIPGIVLNANISSADITTMAEFINFIKQIPSNNRSYDPQNKIWTVQKANFDGLVQIAKNFPMFIHTMSLIRWDSLTYFLANQDPKQISYIAAQQVRTSYSNKSNWGEPEEPEIPEEEFFYTSSQPITQTQAKTTIEQVLCQLFEVTTLPFAKDELTKCYRKAAMKYHPDRNAGDSSKMSELNAAWQQYKIQIGV